MPNADEENALSKIKAYLDAGHDLDAIRQAGWASWIDHLEAKGYDLETGQLTIAPPDASPVVETDSVKEETPAVVPAAKVSAAPVANIPICARCGAERVGMRPYCVKCTAKWPDGTPPGRPVETRTLLKSRWLWAVAGVGVLVLGLVILGSVVGGGGDTGDGDGQSALLDSNGESGDSASPADENASVPIEEESPTKANATTAYSMLALTDIEVLSNGRVSISGTTDLPDGASLSVDFDVSGRADADRYIGVGQKTTVRDGRFSVTLSVPQRIEFETGPYEGSVLFTPRGQSDAVIALVGKDGEMLTGSRLVGSGFGFQMLEVIQQMTLDLSVTVPSYIFQLPSEFAPSSAEHTLATWVVAWRDADWDAMVSASQKTWIDANDDPAATLEAWYDVKSLLGFEIETVQVVSEVTRDITFVVHYELFANEISKKRITAKVIKEVAPYTPSTQGDWGVNPISTLRETDID